LVNSSCNLNFEMCFLKQTKTVTRLESWHMSSNDVTSCCWQDLDAKIASLVIDLQKKKRSLEQEYTETQMMQVSDKGQRSLGHGSEGSWVTRMRAHRSIPRPRWCRSVTRVRGHWVMGQKGHGSVWWEVTVVPWVDKTVTYWWSDGVSQLRKLVFSADVFTDHSFISNIYLCSWIALIDRHTVVGCFWQRCLLSLLSWVKLLLRW